VGRAPRLPGGLEALHCSHSPSRAGGSLPVFTLAWVGNRLVQSIGWAGLLKVSSKWFNYSSYGAIIGVLSVSYLVGDAIARPAMGAMIAHGFGWRALFEFAAAVAALMLLANFFLLRESRVELGFAARRREPAQSVCPHGGTPASLRDLLAPLLRSPAFLLVCLLSFGCTIVRETFNTWTPQYLHGAFGYSAAEAATLSAVFPGVGVVSVLATGWFSDRLGVTGRPAINARRPGRGRATLLALALFPGGAHAGLARGRADRPGRLLPARPYSYLGGAFALDFGGLRAGAALLVSSMAWDTWEARWLRQRREAGRGLRLARRIRDAGIREWRLGAAAAILYRHQRRPAPLSRGDSCLRHTRSPRCSRCRLAHRRLGRWPEHALSPRCGCATAGPLTATRTVDSGFVDVTDLPDEPRIRTARAADGGLELEFEGEPDACH